LYPFYSRQVPGVPTNKKEVLEKFGSVKADEKTIDRMGVIKSKVEGIAHHGNVEKNGVDYVTFKVEDFDALLSEFEEIMLDCLMRQVDVHTEVDLLIAAGVPADAVTV
jgi:hypothetical protein